MNAAPWLATLPPAASEQAPARDLASALCAEAPRLRRLVHRLLGWRTSAHELDDVVQDVLLKAWHHHASFRGEAALATWLTRIAIHQARDHARKTRLRRALFGWLVPFAEPASRTADDACEAPLDRTRRALQQLAADDREVLVLRYLEQRDIAEIALLLAISRAAVDARLSRARARLRVKLGLEARR